ncbi:MAG: hypothetical protein ABI488_11645 [Polyangiaceae bacterium]
MSSPGSNSAARAAAHEWRRRVVAEYNSAAITHSVLGWLLRLGASPTLLHEGVRIIEDELVHAEMAFAVLREAGDAGADVTLGGVPGLELEPGLSLLGNVCVQGVRVFCLGETVAARLFKRRKPSATACGTSRYPRSTAAGSEPRSACAWRRRVQEVHSSGNCRAVGHHHSPNSRRRCSRSCRARWCLP